MSSRETVNAMLNEFTSQVKIAFGEKLSEVILFGSYARGDFDSESDVDIMILMHISRNDERTYHPELLKIMNNIYDKFGYSIVLSPILISYDFFNEWKNDLPFYKNVVSEGVKIVA